jgi:hypothetical protein
MFPVRLLPAVCLDRILDLLFHRVKVKGSLADELASRLVGDGPRVLRADHFTFSMSGSFQLLPKMPFHSGP